MSLKMVRDYLFSSRYFRIDLIAGLLLLFVMFAWIALTGCWREIRRMHPAAGLILAAAPLLAWAGDQQIGRAHV